MWNNVKTALPKVDDLGETELLLCMEANQPWPFVGYLSHGKWYVAHFSAPTTEREVTHWTTLPALPEDDETRVRREYPNAVCVKVDSCKGEELPIPLFRIMDEHEVFSDPIGALQLSEEAAWESAAGKLPIVA